MSYLGYIDTIAGLLSKVDRPRILEVGVDSGQSTIPLLHNMSIHCAEFYYMGVDVRIRDIVREQSFQMMGIRPHPSYAKETCNTFFIEDNSLNLLPKLVSKGLMFDLIFLDGDHNYYTVSRELDLCDKLSHHSTIIVCDDYSGRWADKDLFYSEREEYSDIRCATPTTSTEKHGVKTAIDDFIKKSMGKWAIMTTEFEPVFLYQQSHIDLHMTYNNDVTRSYIAFPILHVKLKSDDSKVRFIL